MLFNNSLRGSKYKSKNENFDYKKELLKQRKINKEFLNYIKLLTLEEIVYLKLDSITTSLNGKLLGFPIMKYFPEICQEAFVLHALSSTKNKRDACVMLGVNRQKLNNMIKKYNIDLEEQVK